MSKTTDPGPDVGCFLTTSRGCTCFTTAVGGRGHVFVYNGVFLCSLPAGSFVSCCRGCGGGAWFFVSTRRSYCVRRKSWRCISRFLLTRYTTRRSPSGATNEGICRWTRAAEEHAALGVLDMHAETILVILLCNKCERFKRSLAKLQYVSGIGVDLLVESTHWSHEICMCPSGSLNV